MFSGNLLTGLSLFTEGLRSLTIKELRPFVILPLLINILVFSALGWVFYHYTDQGADWMLSFLPDWLMWLKYIIMPAVILMFLMLVFFLFNLIANIIAAPFNGLLAERVASRESSDITPYTGTWKALLVRTFAREWEKIKYYLPRVIALTIISWIPLVNLIAPVLWFFFTAWMIAFQYIDFVGDSQGRSALEVREFMGQKKLSTFGLGVVIMFSLAIPVLNFVVIPVAVIAATLYWQREQAAQNSMMGVAR